MAHRICCRKHKKLFEICITCRQWKCTGIWNYLSKETMTRRVHMMTSSNGNIFRVTGLCAWTLTVAGEFPDKGQWRRALMFSLICVWTNSWAINGYACDLRRTPACYDVIIMHAWGHVMRSNCTDLLFPLHSGSCVGVDSANFQATSHPMPFCVAL